MCLCTASTSAASSEATMIAPHPASRHSYCRAIGDVQPVGEQPAAVGMELGGAGLDRFEKGGGPLVVERLGQIGAVLRHLRPLPRHLRRHLRMELDPEG